MTVWSAALDAEMSRQGMSNAALARALGTATGQVWKWRRGVALPVPQNAEAVADALGSPNLARSFLAARRKPCATCGMTFVDSGRWRKALYCGRRCQGVAWGRRARASRGKAGVLAQRRLAIYQAAVARHCRDCEPGGVCHDAACHIRPVSPLPFARVNR